MRIMTFVGALFFGAIAIQAQEPYTPSATSPGELFRVVSSSDFVAIGTVIESRPISKRLTDKEMIALDDLSKSLGGTLYKIKVTSLLCARSALTPGASGPRMPIKHFLIFKRRDTRFTEEVYNQNQQYLIFLTSLPQQKELTREFMLENGQTYYQALEGKKGLIQLTDTNLPLLNGLKEFCGALRPADPQVKLKRLSQLTTSADPDLKQSAIKAIEHIQNARRH